MRYKLSVVALLGVMMVGGANAQGLGVGAQLGYQKAKDADGRYMVGALARLKLSNSLGVEGSINYREEKFGNDVKVKSWPVMITGMLHIFPGIYGAIGAGWYNTKTDFNIAGVDDQTSQEFGWHFGGGVELPLGTSTKLIGDIRYTFIDYNFGNVPFNDVNSNFYTISGGILFGL